MPAPLSLLDRLLDDFPEEQNPRDPDVAADERRRRTWENWREGFRRDLAMLITARAPNPAQNPTSGTAAQASTNASPTQREPFPRVAASVARYGVVPALSGHGLLEAPEAIRAAVATFEPRFRDPLLLPGSAKDGADVVCAISGWVEWDGRRKELLVKVFSEGDAWKVELYE